MEGGRWIFGAVLPARFHDYDVYHGYKVVINEPTPYLHHDVYRVKYAGYKGRRDQVVIRDSHEEKYWEIKEHPEHGKWKGGGHGEKEHGRGEHGEHGRH